MKAVTALLAFSLFSGCGGLTVEQGKGTDGSDEPTEDGADEDDPSSPPPDSTNLPPCQPGFAPEEPDRPCNWMTQDRCFEHKLDACACACPRDTSVASNCASGFPSEDGRVEVYCY